MGLGSIGMHRNHILHRLIRYHLKRMIQLQKHPIIWQVRTRRVQNPRLLRYCITYVLPVAFAAHVVRILINAVHLAGATEPP
ncbi:hypothetical protein CY34DRAFT_322936 [Suillus luteus UH-Slu-Lm8-n1]|uniref:Uncharacterized protein n=1 Tax=Suillus luteus UH-Slu-Lm8-n1 TaxID=930992 RepID=A0A0D0AD54_9AGAM|nr:hypothetical protein CY34DRAFT_322936 [Suillus luteus UH-Slu-Lm8-n1]